MDDADSQPGWPITRLQTSTMATVLSPRIDCIATQVAHVVMQISQTVSIRTLKVCGRDTLSRPH